MKKPLWTPHPENIPQQLAWIHPADELLYGGAAGGGKTDLEIGIAFLHTNAIIFRRTYKQLQAIERRLFEILLPTKTARYNASTKVWRDIPGGRMIDLGAVQLERDVWNFQGRPHDYIGFDELTQFTQFQYTTLIGWLRTTLSNQRVRVVAASNPPPTAEGLWVIQYWAPWLDKRHPNPAKPGELRWFAMIDGQSVERDDDTPFMHGEHLIRPRSRSFLPALLKDNPYLDERYLAVIQGLPEPLRSQLLSGDWQVGMEDAEWQIIPTTWVLEAQERWKERQGEDHGPLTTVGIDVARGGDDKTILAPRYSNYMASLIKRRGPKTPSGQSVRDLLMKHFPLALQPMVNVDVIGVGSSPFDFIKEAGYKFVRAVDVREKTQFKDKTGKLPMRNVRAEMWWHMREILDPETGDDIALPDDPEILADLTAPTYKPTASGILIEEKAAIHKRLGRSPDCGEAVCLSFLRGNKISFTDWLKTEYEIDPKTGKAAKKTGKV